MAKRITHAFWVPTLYPLSLSGHRAELLLGKKNNPDETDLSGVLMQHSPAESFTDFL